MKFTACEVKASTLLHLHWLNRGKTSSGIGNCLGYSDKFVLDITITIINWLLMAYSPTTFVGCHLPIRFTNKMQLIS